LASTIAMLVAKSPWAGSRARSGAAGDLHQQLRHALGGAEVAAVEAVVQVQDAHQRDARQVMPLGQHLGAEQDAVVAALAAAEQAFQLALAAGAVAVDAGQRDARKALAQAVLDALGALAQRAQVRRLAVGAAAPAAGCSRPQWWQSSRSRPRCRVMRASQRRIR
jgi:hypothetical protein